jgi:ribosomal protein S18 acetylase RimI-like enzyme
MKSYEALKESEFNFKKVKRRNARICNDILRSLPLWFGIESAIQRYVSDVEKMPMFVGYVGGKPIAFLSLNLHNKWTAEIHVMGVRPEFHRRGIGKRLLMIAENHLIKRNFEFLTVKTLSSSRSDRGYGITRKFYFSTGFRPVEEFKTLWSESNPCLLMIKSL